MDKQYLLSVIDKYHLNGLVERVKWNIKENVLNVKFISNNKDMVGEVFANSFDLENDEIAIFNTSQLYKLINITGQHVQISFQKKHKITTKLLIADNKYNLEYSLSDLMLIPKTANIEEPQYEVEFDIDKELIDSYVKAKKALPESENVIICSIYDSVGAKTIQFTIGETNDYSNKINFTNPASKMDIPSNELQFNATYIKEIFDCNKDAVSAKGYMTSEGLMKLVFNTDKITSIYFLTTKE